MPRSLLLNRLYKIQTKRSNTATQACTETLYLWDVDSGPEELQVLPHLLRFELGVEDGQLSEHAHVSPLQTQRSLQQSDELFKVPAVLIVADQVLQLIGVDHNMKATDLRQPELLTVHACKADLLMPTRKESSSKMLTFLFPCIGFSVDESDCGV